MLLATLALGLVGLGLPLTPVGTALRLQPLPLIYFPLLTVVLAGYALAVVGARSWYLKRNSRWL